jgi:hypothetical protein
MKKIEYFNNKRVIKTADAKEFMVKCMEFIYSKQEHLSSRTNWNLLMAAFSYFNIAAFSYNTKTAHSTYNDFRQLIMDEYSHLFEKADIIEKDYIFDFEIDLIRRRMPKGDECKANEVPFVAFASHRNSESDPMSGSWATPEVKETVAVRDEVQELEKNIEEEMKKAMESLQGSIDLVKKVNEPKIEWKNSKVKCKVSFYRLVTLLPQFAPEGLLQACKSTKQKPAELFRVTTSGDVIYCAKFDKFKIYYHVARKMYIKECLKTGKFKFYYRKNNHYVCETNSVNLALTLWSLDHVSDQKSMDYTKTTIYKTNGGYMTKYHADGTFQKYLNDTLQEEGTYSIDDRLVPVLKVK